MDKIDKELDDLVSKYIDSPEKPKSYFKQLKKIFNKIENREKSKKIMHKLSLISSPELIKILENHEIKEDL